MLSSAPGREGLADRFDRVVAEQLGLDPQSPLVLARRDEPGDRDVPQHAMTVLPQDEGRLVRLQRASERAR
jgi:hypothetical protein